VWTHIAISWTTAPSKTEAKCFVNGDLKSSVFINAAFNGSTTLNKKHYQLGMSKDKLADPTRIKSFKGYISDVVMYNRTLSADEIKENMALSEYVDALLLVWMITQQGLTRENINKPFPLASMLSQFKPRETSSLCPKYCHTNVDGATPISIKLAEMLVVNIYNG